MARLRWGALLVGVVSVGAGLLIGCTSDGDSDPPVADAPATDPSTADPSLDLDSAAHDSLTGLEYFPSEDYTDSETGLLENLVAPTDLDDDFLVFVTANDPSGDGTIGDRWFEPTVPNDVCAIGIDGPELPQVSGNYHNGRPEDSFSDDISVLSGAGYSITSTIFFFDDTAQRDTYGQRTRRHLKQLESCSFGRDAPVGEPVDLDPVGCGDYPGSGSQPSDVTISYLCDIGDRVLLNLVVSTSGFGRSVEPQELDQLNSFAELQVSKLRQQGLG